MIEGQQMQQENSKKTFLTERHDDDSLKMKIVKLVELIGRPAEELKSNWVKYLIILNASSFVQSYSTQMIDRYRFPLPNGEKKIASFNVMNFKYVGLLKAALVIHILSGTTAVLSGAAAVYYEQRDAVLSNTLAYVASFMETFFHAPTALAMSPFVYGDKNVSPPVYAIQSSLLWLAAARALIESTDEEAPDGPKPELHRMMITLGVFQYVRQYTLLAGLNGILQPEKYTNAILAAGFVMLPIAWNGALFPAAFWTAMVYNWRTAVQTVRLIHFHGVDGAAKIQSKNRL